MKTMTNAHHPSVMRNRAAHSKSTARGKIVIPANQSNVEINVGGGVVALSNLQKVFWPEGSITKRDLLQYYADVSPWLLPHLVDRAMVMKRYPDGAYGKFFFQKRAPEPRPKWIPICAIQHPSANLVDFPVIQNLAGLLWVVNLGCIDLNPWYARCDDVDRPDYLHFDLDPTPGSNFGQVREAALGCATGVQDRQLSENHGVAWDSHLYSDRARAITERSLGFRERIGEGVGEKASEDHYRGVQSC